ncbi:hypothetical protein Vse01_27520 [Micromonospora sediminimaris]|uniref:Uncharacterized protein n=1 Tax=Micromonospora sediminimaris TaxID=547162 RepID=A0A9W5XK51_9ACTN|nr:hypothetical protein Vse01_27520 [Micromonospora sediminimaris]
MSPGGRSAHRRPSPPPYRDLTDSAARPPSIIYPALPLLCFNRRNTHGKYQRVWHVGPRADAACLLKR